MRRRNERFDTPVKAWAAVVRELGMPFQIEAIEVHRYRPWMAERYRMKSSRIVMMASRDRDERNDGRRSYSLKRRDVPPLNASQRRSKPSVQGIENSIRRSVESPE